MRERLTCLAMDMAGKSLDYLLACGVLGERCMGSHECQHSCCYDLKNESEKEDEDKKHEKSSVGRRSMMR